MTFLTINKRPVSVNISKYFINWDSDSASKFQTNTKRWLKTFWLGEVVLEEFRIPRTLLRVDFLNLTKRIIIEVNGNQHRAYNKHFHKGSRIKYLNQIKRDVEKERWGEINNFTYCEVFEEDIPLTPLFFQKTYGVEI